MTTPIPQPPTQYFVGNVRSIDPENTLASLSNLADQYGPIFKLEFFGKKRIIVSSEKLVREVCDESRFQKLVTAGLLEVRHFAGDGLFTADQSNPNWALAHKILVPAFGTVSIANMFPQMLDIADQLVKKFERFGPDAIIDVPHDMTKLALDTIALCSFGYRFNSFYQSEMHPFVDAMTNCLHESGLRGLRTSIQNQLYFRATQKFNSDIQFMFKMADDIVKQRKAHPTQDKDLLNAMLNGRDPETGEGLSDENIRFQMITFLIAGHETTSGLLSFCLYLLLKNPEALRKARKEVDTVLGDQVPRVESISHLKYIDAALKETLRLYPSAPAFTLGALHETTIGEGKYQVSPDDAVVVLAYKLHRDPEAWGPDAEEFKPERMLRENSSNIPQHAWKPFGNGQRACIGRNFAVQESILALSMILQKFDLKMHDPSYEMQIKQTLTIKPDKFYIHAKARSNGMDSPTVGPSPQVHRYPLPAQAIPKSLLAVNGLPLVILYGSNSGSCESFAQRINMEAKVRGYAPRLETLDSASGKLPAKTPVIILTSSYEGKPPSNARHFVEWLSAVQEAKKFEGVNYTVFGAGNRNWAYTYQAIPKLVDAKLEEFGAKRILERGEADEAGDFFGSFDEWYEKLWPALAKLSGSAEVPDQASLLPVFTVKIDAGPRFSTLRLQGLKQGTIREVRVLSPASETGHAKHHIEIELPSDYKYKCGEYLAVLPVNPLSKVRKVLQIFGLTMDAQITIESSGTTTLPTNRPVSALEILGGYIELAQPATRKQIETVAASCSDEAEKVKCANLAKDVYETEILAKRVSVLDLLEDFPSHMLPFAAFLAMAPAMRIRQYSISSSPLWNPNHVTLTIDVLHAPALSGHGDFVGVASNFLGHLQKGDRISVAVRPCAGDFYPPVDPETPIVMIAAGTGISPFRGFIQERAAQLVTGRKVGPALLFYGCRDPDADYLYKSEFENWEKFGAVTLKPVFSRKPEGDRKYVQHRIYHDRAEIIDIYGRGAKFYVCGSTKMAQEVKETLIKIIAENNGVSIEEAKVKFEKIESSRFATDVFG